jgi:hypothetical protein
MRALSILFFLIGGVLAVGGAIQASKPSISPLVTVIGAFTLPALFIWWGLICHKRAKNARQSKSNQG